MFIVGFGLTYCFYSNQQQLAKLTQQVKELSAQQASTAQQTPSEENPQIEQGIINPINSSEESADGDASIDASETLVSTIPSDGEQWPDQSQELPISSENTASTFTVPPSFLETNRPV